MQILYFFESIRNPVLDAFFSFITHFGEESIFIVLALFLFWCVDKYEGYYVLSVGFLGTLINQALKIMFRIERPWVKDPNFTIVESARAEATGYSFPSGHTQSSVGNFGSILKYGTKNRIINIICFSLCILVPISRLYLGVHTIYDVVVSVTIALILIFVIHPIILKAKENPKIMWAFLAVMTLISLILVIYISVYNFPENTDKDNLEHAVGNFYKLFGAVIGMCLVYFIDTRYINFKTEATTLGHVLKLVLGLVIVLAIKSGLKVAFNMLFDYTPILDSIRYFVLIVVAGNVWPLTFKKLSVIGKK